MGRVWLVLVMVMVTRIVSVNKANCSFRVWTKEVICEGWVWNKGKRKWDR
jgi:hypothetical protein